MGVYTMSVDIYTMSFLHNARELYFYTMSVNDIYTMSVNHIYTMLVNDVYTMSVDDICTIYVDNISVRNGNG